MKIQTPQLATSTQCPLIVCSQAGTHTCSEHNRESNLQEIIAGRCVLGSSSELRLFLSVRQPTQLPSSSAALGEGTPAVQGRQFLSNPGLRQAIPSESKLWRVIEFKGEKLNLGDGEELYGLGCVGQQRQQSTHSLFSTYLQPIHTGSCWGNTTRSSGTCSVWGLLLTSPALSPLCSSWPVLLKGWSQTSNISITWN